MRLVFYMNGLLGSGKRKGSRNGSFLIKIKYIVKKVFDRIYKINRMKTILLIPLILSKKLI
jgi:hypothetical protein